MTIEADLKTALAAVLGTSEVYPDVGIDPVPPYVTFQQVGGESLAFMGLEVPSKRNGRFQINAWAATRPAASTLIRSIHDALIVNASMQATALGEPISTYEPETKLFGSMQDFSLWFAA